MSPPPKKTKQKKPEKQKKKLKQKKKQLSVLSLAGMEFRPVR